MRRLLPMVLASFLATSLSLGLSEGCASCDEPPGEIPPEEDGPAVHGLTPAQAAATIATVGEREITVGELAGELASKGSFVRTRFASPERRREFLDQMIRFELLAQEAERRGYDDLPEVQRTRKQMMIRRFLAERFEQGGPESVPAEDIAEYYESHRSEFHTPAQVRASHILCPDRATAQRVLAELQENPTSLPLYRRLAEQHNTDPATRDRFGDLRFFSRPDERLENEPPVAEEVATAAFTIEAIGGIHPEVVQSEAGFHIIKLTGRRAAMHRSLEEATRPVRNRLWRERRESAIQALIDELRQEADVEEDLSMLDQVQLDLPAGGTPTVNPPTPGAPPGTLVPPPRPPGGQ